MKLNRITIAVLHALGEIAARYQGRARLDRCCSACRAAAGALR